MKIILISLAIISLCVIAEAQYRSDDATAINDEGVRLLSGEHVQQAIERFERSIQLSPRFPVALYNLATAYYRNGQLDRAIDALRLAINYDPLYAKAFNQLGVIYFEIQQVEKALLLLNKAVALDKRDPLASYNLGMAYISTADYGKAIAALANAKSVDDKNASIRKMLGYALYRRKHYSDAAHELTEAVKLDGNDEQSLLLLASIYTLTDRKALAIAEYSSIKNSRPALAEAIYKIIYEKMLIKIN
jgi:superkiller protein 3